MARGNIRAHESIKSEASRLAMKSLSGSNSVFHPDNRYDYHGRPIVVDILWNRCERTIILETLKMFSDMVGLFSAFEVFTRNAEAAYGATSSMLEQLDAAHETGKITGVK